MGNKKVIAVFDVGKTNKKVLLFDDRMKPVFQEERKFGTITDEDGFECDDLTAIETWLKESIHNLIRKESFHIRAVNFCTHGASLAFIDEHGNRLTPLYNYLKEIPAAIQESLFEKYGGKEEFCRKTASPPLGKLLNSGIQILWLKQTHPEIFGKVRYILHYPQYLSYLLTGRIFSEPTSIGSHTFLWDFDHGHYHRWLYDEKIDLPQPVSNSCTELIDMHGSSLNVGIGIHDSSASLLPYLLGSKSRFLLVSTGTWCITMNPFNNSPLTSAELHNGCLAYLSVEKKPVKSSMLFMGHIHDVNQERIRKHFRADESRAKSVRLNVDLVKKYLNEQENTRIFFEQGIPSDYVDESVDLSRFDSYAEAYHRLIYDLTLISRAYIQRVIAADDGVDHIYISGGFSRNEIYVRLLATFFPEKKVFTSEVDNSSALGAALAIWHTLNQERMDIDLNLSRWQPVE